MLGKRHIFAEIAEFKRVICFIKTKTGQIEFFHNKKTAEAKATAVKYNSTFKE